MRVPKIICDAHAPRVDLEQTAAELKNPRRNASDHSGMRFDVVVLRPALEYCIPPWIFVFRLGICHVAPDLYRVFSV